MTSNGTFPSTHYFKPEPELPLTREDQPADPRDMFNTLNYLNLSGPSTGLNGAIFGEINGEGRMRVIQLNGGIRW